jgi:polyisoprenoid-binding protein YceI
MKNRNLIVTARACRLAVFAAAGLLALTTALAAPQTFDFKDPKGVNNAVFLLDAPLESINGTASGISGTVRFDPANPASLSGRIVVEAASLHVPNPMMKEHLHGKDWLDVATHKEITFETVQVANVKTSGADTTADVTGKLTIKGVTHEITVPVRLTYLPDKLGARTNGRMQGDLLVVRSTFKIKRGDFGINPGAPTDKVADEIELTLSLAGAAPRT